MSPPSGSQARPGRASWPLVVLVCGLPLWWVAGLFSIMPLLLSVPMAWQLLRLRTVHLPRGFGWWLLFLMWVALGVGVLGAHAPGSVDEGGAGRYLVFGYRLWWYVACTVVLLWIVNLSREALPDRRVLRLAGLVFLVTALGGVLGVLRPELQFRSLLELVLPGGLRHNEFVSSLIHPEAADLQSVLGRPEPRPKAPFPFTNTWGSVFSLSLVFFLAALREARTGARVVAAAVLAVAVAPVLYSLNRGLWASLALGAVGLVVLVVMRRGPQALPALAALVTVIVVVGISSPVGAMVQERLNHQHSNERRSQLLEDTMHSVTTGSPLVGFGSTRDVQGSYFSISGAATPDCPACGVPPLGTQGQLWLILFSQGWLGLAFFLVFVLLALSRCWRCRTLNQTVCTFVLVFFLLQLPIYDSLDLSLLLVVMALGLVFRDELLDPKTAPADQGRTVGGLTAQLRSTLPVLCVLMGIGGLAGAAVATSRPPAYERSVWIELAPAPVALDRELAAVDGSRPVPKKTRALTLDTESALVRSNQSLSAASRVSGRSSASLDRAIEVAAVPSSRVLVVSVLGYSRSQAVRDSNAVVDAYLETRTAWLDKRRTRLTTGLEDQMNQLRTNVLPGQPTRSNLNAVMARLTSADTSAGTVVRASGVGSPPSRTPEAVTSGVALGLLAGCLRLRSTRRQR